MSDGKEAVRRTLERLGEDARSEFARRAAQAWDDAGLPGLAAEIRRDEGIETARPEADPFEKDRVGHLMHKFHGAGLVIVAPGYAAVPPCIMTRGSSEPFMKHDGSLVELACACGRVKFDEKGLRGARRESRDVYRIEDMDGYERVVEFHELERNGVLC